MRRVPRRKDRPLTTVPGGADRGPDPAATAARAAWSDALGAAHAEVITPAGHALLTAFDGALDHDGRPLDGPLPHPDHIRTVLAAFDDAVTPATLHRLGSTDRALRSTTGRAAAPPSRPAGHVTSAGWPAVTCPAHARAVEVLTEVDREWAAHYPDLRRAWAPQLAWVRWWPHPLDHNSDDWTPERGLHGTMRASEGRPGPWHDLLGTVGAVVDGTALPPFEPADWTVAALAHRDRLRPEGAAP